MSLLGNASPAPQQRQAVPVAPAKTSKLFGGGFADAKPAADRQNYLEAPADGTAALYTVKVNRVVMKAESADDFNKDLAAHPDDPVYSEVAFKQRETFIVEGEVLASTYDKCPIGFEFSWVTYDRKNPEADYFAPEVKSFIGAAAGDDPMGVTLEHVRSVAGKKQLLAGALVNVAVKLKKNTKKEGSFTKHVWAPYVAAEGQVG